MRFLFAVINKFKAYYSSPPAFFATFVYSDALLPESMAWLFCTKFQITRVTPTYLSTFRQHSETEIEKFFNWIGSNKIPPVWVISTRCFPSLQICFSPFSYISSISFWKCNLRWQMCVRRKKGFRLSQLKFVHFRLATEMILSSLSERKRKAHLSSQNPDVEEKMKIKVNALLLLLFLFADWISIPESVVVSLYFSPLQAYPDKA